MSNMMRSARNCDVCKCCMDVSTASFRQKEKAQWQSELELPSGNFELLASPLYLAYKSRQDNLAATLDSEYDSDEDYWEAEARLLGD